MSRPPRAGPELLLMIAMVAVSVALAIIQYNWTGRLSRAESEHLRAVVRDQLRQINRAWTAEMNEAYRELLPTPEEVERDGDAAYAAHYRQWLAREHHPLFTRFYVENTSDPTAGAANTDAFHFEMPGARPEQWMVFDLDPEYLRRTWLPESIRVYLAGAPSEFRVRVRTAGTAYQVIYDSQPGSGAESHDPLATAEMSTLRGARDRSGAGERHWIIEAWNRSGSLDAAVSAARWRNFAVACALIVLLLAAGCALLHYTAQARRLADMQFQFVAGVSHEMRTPLAVIRGAGQNVASGVVHERGDVQRYALMIVKHADDLADTLEQVLNFAAARRGAPQTAETVSVAQAIDEAVEASAPEIEVSGCRLRVDVAPELPPVLGSAAGLRRAFQNLIANAARHGRDGGWIGVSAEALESGGRQVVEVKVTDCGPGIPASEIPRIFDPFYRGERARSTQIRGAGLGLSLLREIVRAHGATVSVRSEPGRLTEFSLRFPVVLVTPDACANSAD